MQTVSTALLQKMRNTGYVKQEGSGRLEQPAILWVEDDPLHMMATSWLRDAGFRVVPAATFLEARERILTEPRLDLAILDVNVRVAAFGAFPPMDFDVALTKGGAEAGPALGRLILEHRSDLPFVGVSGLFNEPVSMWFETHGAGYLSKTEIRRPDEFVNYVRSRTRTSVLTGSQIAKGVAMTSEPSIVTRREKSEELTIKLRHLELEYELARAGMLKSGLALGGVLVTTLAITGMGFAASMWGRREFLTGGNIVVISGVAALALLGFASLVFGRSFKLKSQISKTKKELEVILGEGVR